MPGLEWQFIKITPDNLNIAALSPNTYIHTGDGNDGINVSYKGGNNTLDGEGGSNFLAGGNGNDTFFVNDLDATTPSWTTIEGFHTGDAATIWGLTPTDFQFAWMDGGGAVGHQGLTLYATAPNKPEIAITLAGASIADLSSGKLVFNSARLMVPIIWRSTIFSAENAFLGAAVRYMTGGSPHHITKAVLMLAFSKSRLPSNCSAAVAAALRPREAEKAEEALLASALP